MEYVDRCTVKVKTYHDLLVYLQNLSKKELAQKIQIHVDHDEILHPEHVVTVVDSDEVPNGQIAIALHY